MFIRAILIIGLLIFSGELFADDIAEKTVPIAGVFNGYLLGLNENPTDIAARCDPPAGQDAWAIASFSGWGSMSHLGEITWYAEHCSYVDGAYGEGELIFTADNGDELLATYSQGISLSPPPIVVFTDRWIFIDGGTGRFTYASGGGSEMGAVDFRDYTFSAQMSGVISYKKKSK